MEDPASSESSSSARVTAGQPLLSLRGALLRLLLASQLPLVLVASAFLWMEWEWQRTAVMDGLRQQVQTLALAVEQELGINLAILETLAALPDVEARKWDEFHAVATAAIRPRAPSWIVVQDPSGQQLVNTHVPYGTDLPRVTGEQPGVEWRGLRLPTSDRRLRDPANLYRPVISNLVYGPVLKQPVLGASIPVLHDGNRSYRLFVGFTPDTLGSLLAHERSPDATVTVIVDGNGRLIARNRDGNRFLGMRASPPFDRSAALGWEGIGEMIGREGQPLIYAYRRIRSSDWVVAVAIPRQQVFAPVYRTFIPWLVAILLMAGVGLWLAHRLQRRLAMPLVALAGSADALQHGGTVPIPAPRIRELDTLSRALQRAARQEQAARAELARRLASEEQARMTAQRLANTLKESEERFRLLADNMAQLAWIADANGNIGWYNRRWFDYTGTTPDQMERDGWRAVLHPDHAACVVEKIARCLKQGERWEDTFPLRGADGGYRWFLSRALPVYDDGERLMSWFGTHTDVTAQLEAEAQVRALNADLEQRVDERTSSLQEKSRELEQAADALRVNEARLQGILQNTSAVIYVQDTDGRYVLLNRQFAETLGLAREELIGKTAFDIFPAELAQQTLQEDKLILADGKPLQLERNFPIPGRGLRTFLLTRFPMRGDDGKIYGLGGIATDITDLKHAERELEATLNFLRAILESANYAIIATDTHGTIRTFNPAAEGLLGYAADEVIGKATPELFHVREEIAERAAALEREFGEPAGTGFDVLIAKARRQRVEEDERVFVRKNGSRVPVLLSITAVRDAQGVITGYLGIAADISARKAADAAIAQLNRTLARRAAELEALNRELESFSYSVSHDLRAPLRSIDGFSQVLLEDYAERLDEEGRDSLRRVRAASQRMAQLIDDLLRLSRLSRAEIRYQTMDLSAIARAVAGDLKALEPQRQVEFVIEDGVSAQGDARLLRAVLENLLGNAWKYTSRHAHGRIEFGTELDGNGARVYYVRDDGAGFDMTYAGKLFGAFQRLHTEAEFPGTGIGLSIVQRIVHRHGGEVWATAAPEAGATFRFVLGEPTQSS
jgi:PAS domain S-box-containing protein